MSYSEMLHEFMENDLPTNREETLFHALARDEDLRFEMKYLLNLRSAVQEDDEAGVVPLASTQSLFSRLGYAAAIPAAETAAGAAVAEGTGSGIGALLRGWGGHLLAGVVGMLLAGSFFVLGEPTEATVAGNSSLRESSTVAAAGSDAGLPVEEGSAAEMQATASDRSKAGSSLSSEPTVTLRADGRAPQRRVIHPASPSVPAVKTEDLAAKRTEESDQTQGNVSNGPSSIASIEAEKAGHENASMNKPTIRTNVELSLDESLAATAPASPEEFYQSSRSATPVAQPLQLPETKYRETGTISLSARTSATPFNLRESKLGLDLSKDQGITDGWGLGVEYSVTPSISFGLEMGVDPYLLYFREERANGIVNEHEVYDSRFWMGASARWTPLEAGPVPLFVQGTIGGSYTGLMTRLMVGGELDLKESITLIGGAEFSSVGYQYDNNILFSPRLGLVGGIRLNNLFDFK